MKRIIAAILSFAIIFTLTACGQAKQENMEKNDAGELQNMQTMDVDKTLILYFSYSGNTEKVAKQIADYTGADIIRLEPVDPYPEDYDACVARAEAEHPANARPELKTEDVYKRQPVSLSPDCRTPRVSCSQYPLRVPRPRENSRSAR